LATAAVASVPPAPGRASMTICWPRRADIFSPTTRDTVSSSPPTGNAISSLIGFVG
jgi:hypothetical protein